MPRGTWAIDQGGRTQYALISRRPASVRQFRGGLRMRLRGQRLAPQTEELVRGCWQLRAVAGLIGGRTVAAAMAVTALDSSVNRRWFFWGLAMACHIGRGRLFGMHV